MFSTLPESRRAQSLPKEVLNDHFCKDLNPPLNLKTALVESSRCFYCYDAPCIEACPTGINIPSFIQNIATGNPLGAAETILSSNIMGASCARVCPVESLCQQACVRNKSEDTPVEIGNLQRYAVDRLFETKSNPFKRLPSTGKKVAVVGAGPAGFSCAHSLSLKGHDVTVYEAKPKSGGLNEYGLAPFKVVDDLAQQEIDFILSTGGIEVKHGMRLGQEITLDNLRKTYDAVFLGIGLADVNHTGIESEKTNGIVDAIEFIEALRQTKDLSRLSVGKNVVVIGGGSTAIDVAMESKRLGAENVTLVYRRGEAEMSCTDVERMHAKEDGVNFILWAKPNEFHKTGDWVSEAVFEKTKLSDKKLVGTGETFTLPADQVFLAIGQKLSPEKQLGQASTQLEIANGKIWVNERLETSLTGVFAGGDCINAGKLTVVSVQDGKIAANSIHAYLGESHG